MATAAPNANSAAAKKLGLDTEAPLPSAGPQPTTDDSQTKEKKKGWRERRRRSEWVFRPLRVKFKVKELEELYKNFVFRQKQFLLFSACVLMAFLSFLFVLTYLGGEKVSRTSSLCWLATTPIHRILCFDKGYVLISQLV